VKVGLTGETGGVGDDVSGATKRNAGMCAGIVNTELVEVRRGECICGRGKLGKEVSRVAGTLEETAESERVMDAAFKGGTDLRAWAQGVVQTVFECPQA
jgi:hypothetical protein